MLRLWRDTLRVLIAPERLLLVRTSRWRKRVIEQRVIDIVQTGDAAAGWQEALQALTRAAREGAWQRTDVRVVLSNRLLRFMLAPAPETSAVISDNALIANHYFKQAYGEVAAGWVCRMDDDGGPVAMALDRALLEAVTHCFAAPDYRLLSVRPALAVVFNRWRRLFGAGTHWFAMAEAGHACVCLLQAGLWRQVRGIASADDLPAEVLRTLTREQILAGVDAAPGELALFALDGKIAERFEAAGCKVRRLTLPAPGVQSAPSGMALALAA